MDAMYAFPSLLLAIVAAFALARFVGQGVPAAAISISVIYIPQYFRVVRNHTLAVREETFVDAARAMGAHRRTIVGRYVFFNVVQSVPVIFTVNAADAILTLAALGLPRLRRADPGRGVGLRHLPGHRRRGQRLLVDVAVPGAVHPRPRHRPDPAGRGDQRHRQPPAPPAGRRGGGRGARRDGGRAGRAGGDGRRAGESSPTRRGAGVAGRVAPPAEDGGRRAGARRWPCRRPSRRRGRTRPCRCGTCG